MKWPSVPLVEVATIDRRAVKPYDLDGQDLYVGLENINSNGEFEGVAASGEVGLKSNKFVFTGNHVLYGKLRPYLAKIAAPNFEGICSTDILPVRPSASLDRRYLLHYLRTPAMVAHATNNAVGAHLPRLNPKALESFEIPLPPIDEQRRIAVLLDAADALRAKRRQALTKLDMFLQAVFTNVFGDLTSTERVRFETLLVKPLRNGISPSRSGRFTGTVLTLSAITGQSFDSHAVKESTFTRPHIEEQTVSVESFLVCRGNGNLALVGRGKYPEQSLPGVAFPDTMIAARCDPEKISSDFLSRIWDSPIVRRQIESAARTTNGTHKINQTTIKEVEIPIPGIKLQRQFEHCQKVIALQRDRLNHSALQFDSLFASLQQRAFRGEL